MGASGDLVEIVIGLVLFCAACFGIPMYGKHKERKARKKGIEEGRQQVQDNLKAKTIEAVEENRRLENAVNETSDDTIDNIIDEFVRDEPDKN